MKKTLITIISITLALTMAILIMVVPSLASNEASTPSKLPTTKSGVVENDNLVTDATNNIVFTTLHMCKVAHAAENYHRFSCEECNNYNRVYHTEDTMNVLSKNDFFHTWECKECGYEYAEKHDFSTTYTTTCHQEVCEDCGYAQPAETHEMINDFWSNYHDIICDHCGFIETHHVGVKYEAIDANSCQATCSCGVIEVVEHDWDGFVCDNCNYLMRGETYAIVSRIIKNEDGDYRVRFVDNAGTHRVNLLDVTGFKEGDFVKITHHGNDIRTISVIVDSDIVNDEENFINYISDQINEKSEDLEFDDLVISEIKYFENVLDITFESDRSTSFFNFSEYIVYDIMEGEISVLQEDYAYLTFYVGSTIYFICFW